MTALSLRAPAKINLCLSVLARRPDGYHEVRMLMQAVGLYDEVNVSLARSGVTVQCEPGTAPQGEENIAHRAAQMMLDQSGAGGGVAVSIRKNIPLAAGLGGGSSDAAAVLFACNRLLTLGFGSGQLAEIGTKLGMDVPFFFFGPTAVAEGRGEILRQIPPPPLFWVLLINPGFETSTAWVYKNVNLGLTKKVDCNKIVGLGVGQIAQSLHNDLESVTAAAHPVIGEMKTALLEQGALGALMTGSGPTVFGVFASEAACRTAARNLSPRGWRLFPAPILTESLFAG